MMNDTYAEWLVKRKEPAYAWPLKVLMIFLCVVGFLAASMIGIIGIIILAVVAAGTYFVFQNLKIEFEYLYVTGQFSVDKIMNQQRRKKVMECAMEDIKIVAPEDSYLLKDHSTTNMKIVDASSKDPQAKKYALIYQSGSNTTKVIFEPNDKILQCLRYSAPRKVIL